MPEHYINGRKYCRRCEEYFKTEKFFCPDCGKQLRSKPRATSTRKKFLAKLRHNKSFKKYYNRVKNDLTYREKERLRASIYYYLNRDKILAKMSIKRECK